MVNRFSGKYSFLSNFYTCSVKYQGINYPSVEHFYVAMKSNDVQLVDGVHYTSDDFRKMISLVSSAGLVKKIGSGINIRSDWKTEKISFMNFGIREKFKNVKLAEMLLSTGDSELIEGNYWHDCWWGKCDCERCLGKGKNKLGIILMKVRKELCNKKRVM
jgi:hypothetical protein